MSLPASAADVRNRPAAWPSPGPPPPPSAPTVLRRAADLYEADFGRDLRAAGARGRQDPGRCRLRTARGGGFPALLRRRRRPASPHPPRGIFACISPWNFPLAIFYRPDRRRPGRRQRRAGQTRRADPADRRPRRRPAARAPVFPPTALQLLPGDGARRRRPDPRPARERRGLHRLDRDRADDPPQHGRPP